MLTMSRGMASSTIRLDTVQRGLGRMQSSMDLSALVGHPGTAGHFSCCRRVTEFG